MKKLFILAFALLSFLSSAFGQDITALNGYKYVFVGTLKYNDGGTDIWGISYKLRSYFSEKGFLVLSEQSTPVQEVINDRGLLLICHIEHSNRGFGTNSVKIVLRNFKNEIVYSNTGKAMGLTTQEDFNMATKKAFARIAAFQYRFDPSLTPTIDSPEIEKTNETEETIRTYLGSESVDQIEGIYNSYQTEGMPFYKLGIIKAGDNYKAIIIESSFRSWRPGEVKAYFEKSSMNNIYAVKWFMGDKTRYDTFGTMDNEGLLSIELKNIQTGEKQQDKFVKMFPPISGNIVSRPGGITGTGSGFFIAASGVIATNAHLIEGANSIEITVSNEIGNFKYKATVLLSDNKNDVALIQIDDEKFKGLSSLPYGFIEKAEAGEKVFTIGFPLNDIMGTNYKVTDGIISAKSGVGDDVRYFQITVPLQPGNSGGPLFNKDGNVIGLTSAKLNPGAVGTGVENVNYAIKVSYLINLYDMLPNSAKLPISTSLNSKQLQDQVKILKNYVCLIRVK